MITRLRKIKNKFKYNYEFSSLIVFVSHYLTMYVRAICTFFKSLINFYYFLNVFPIGMFLMVHAW